MANNINSRIYKNRAAALKHAKKVNGIVTKRIEHSFKSHGKHAIVIDNITYIVSWGEYKCIA